MSLHTIKIPSGFWCTSESIYNEERDSHLDQIIHPNALKLAKYESSDGADIDYYECPHCKTQFRVVNS